MAGFRIRYGAGGRKKQIKGAYGEIKRPAVRATFRYVMGIGERLRISYKRIKWPHEVRYQFRCIHHNQSGNYRFEYPEESGIEDFGIRYKFRMVLSRGRRYRFQYGQGYGSLYVEDMVRPFMQTYRRSFNERMAVALPFSVREIAKVAGAMDFFLIIREAARQTVQSQAFSCILRESNPEDTMTMQDVALPFGEVAVTERTQEFSLIAREIAEAAGTWGFTLLIREIARTEKTHDFSLLIREIADAAKTADFSFILRGIGAAGGTQDFSFIVREIADAISTVDFSFLIREIYRAEHMQDFSFIVREIVSAETTWDFSFILREIADGMCRVNFSFIPREIAEAGKTEEFSFIIREAIGELPEVLAAFIIREVLEQGYGQLIRPEAEGAIEITENQVIQDKRKDGDMEQVEERLERDIRKDGAVDMPAILVQADAKMMEMESACLGDIVPNAVLSDNMRLLQKRTEGIITVDWLLKKWQEVNTGGEALFLQPNFSELGVCADSTLAQSEIRTLQIEQGTLNALEGIEKEVTAWVQAMTENRSEGHIHEPVMMECIKEALADETILTAKPLAAEFEEDKRPEKIRWRVETEQEQTGEKTIKPSWVVLFMALLQKGAKENWADIRTFEGDKLPDVLQTEKIARGAEKQDKEDAGKEQNEVNAFTFKEWIAEISADPLMRKSHEIERNEGIEQGRKLEKDAFVKDDEATFKDKAEKLAAIIQSEQAADKKRRLFDGLIEQAEKEDWLEQGQHESISETPEAEKRLYREPEGLSEEVPDDGVISDRIGAVLKGLLLDYPELTSIVTARRMYGDEKQVIAESDLPALNPWADVAIEEMEKRANLYQRFWIIGQSDYKDWIILPPHDFDYEGEPIIFDVPKREDYNQCVYPNEFYRKVDRHPIQPGKNVGREEIGVSVGIMVDLINIYIMMWFKFTPAFWGWTGFQAVTGMMDAVYEYLTLETTMQKRRNKAVSEDYDRAYQWLRWNAEAVVLKARDDQNLRGNYYVEVLLEQLIQYMIDHHFDVMPIFRDVNKMDQWRMAFGRTKGKDIKWVIDKVKGIRHKLLEARHYQEE